MSKEHPYILKYFVKWRPETLPAYIQASARTWCTILMVQFYNWMPLFSWSLPWYFWYCCGRGPQIHQDDSSENGQLNSFHHIHSASAYLVLSNPTSDWQHLGIPVCWANSQGFEEAKLPTMMMQLFSVPLTRYLRSTWRKYMLNYFQSLESNETSKYDER